MTVPSASPDDAGPARTYLRRDVGEEAPLEIVAAFRIGRREAGRREGGEQDRDELELGTPPEAPVRPPGSPTRSGASRLGSWRRIACSRCWSSGLGSRPSSSTSVVRRSWYARSASAWRPARYRASISCAWGRSWSGSAAMSASMSPISAACCPRAISALDPVPDDRQPRLLEPGDRRGGEGLAGEVGQWGAGRQRLGSAEEPGRAGWVAAVERPSATPRETVESREVELVGLDPKEVAAGAGEQSGLALPRLHDAAEARDVDLQRVLGRRRRRLAPERVDEPVDRDELVGMEEQDGEHRTLLAALERQLRVAVADRERSKDPELHPLRDLRREGSTCPLSRH